MQWVFKNAKVNDVFESQIVDLLFVNDDLQKNSYATISIKFDEHVFDSPINLTNKFQPFNIPSTSIIEKEYKFHMKFNAKERTGAIPNYNSNCENSLMLGNTGPDALPKIILGWDWNDITPASIKDNYLDATQFSILISKKLSSINEFLTNNQAICPKNPADLILEKVVPPIFNLDIFSENCFLPLSTKLYDNKPALYYYLVGSSNSNINMFEDSLGLEKINNINEFIEFIDFNVNLMRDGFGLEFQDDFTEYYTKKLFDAPIAFLDPINGVSRYFKNSDYLYFTSNEIDLLPKNDFSTNDSGLYNIKLLIDFKEFPLINEGRINSKIKVVLDLIKPINDNYSPFYYTPFNGGVGLSLDNDRRFYGTSLSSGSNFELIKNISLNNNQRDSLFKINYVEQKDIFKLNSVKSNRSKLFIIDFKNNNLSIINSPTLATPLLFKLNADVGEFPFFEYNLLSGKNKLNGKTHNLFLFNSIVGCKDFEGNLMDYLKDSPDFLNGKNYAIGFDQALISGDVLVKTIAYAAQDTDFSIFYQTNSKGNIISTGSSSNGLARLDGINGMPYNSIEGYSKLNDLRSLFDAVESGAVCVSSLGEREIYYWPEEKLYQINSQTLNKSLNDEINIAKLECIR